MNGDWPDYGTCPVCGYMMMPILELMPCGHDAVPQRAPLDSVGQVYSWTRSWHGEGLSTLIAMADFFEGRLRITAPVVNAESVEVGDTIAARASDEGPYVLVVE